MPGACKCSSTSGNERFSTETVIAVVEKELILYRDNPGRGWFGATRSKLMAAEYRSAAIEIFGKSFITVKGSVLRLAEPRG